jgi:NADH-quinone oxidoreductase subunit H
MEMARSVFYFLVFPGFLFTALVGLLSVWIDRKVTARVQWRVGPPVLQPVYDFLKLLGKETLVPETASRGLFLLAPLVALVSVTLVSTILWLVNLTGTAFVGDLIVVVYLMVMPSLALMMGALASANPLATTGASREMKLMVAYELPFLICLAVVILKSGLTISLVRIAEQPVIGSVSGAVAAVVALLCIQAKLGFTPFDVAEAETEIMGGVTIEYSGPPLAVFKLSQAMLLFTLPVFLITVFWGGIRLAGWGILHAILKYVLILVLIVVIKNTNPRIRIDQAVRFFWRMLTPLALASFVAAVCGQLFAVPWL